MTKSVALFALALLAACSLARAYEAEGFAIAPANAHPWARAAAHWVTPRPGGEGAARDACDLLLHAQGRVEAILAHGEHP